MGSRYLRQENQRCCCEPVRLICECAECLELLHHCWGLDSRWIDEIDFGSGRAVLPSDDGGSGMQLNCNKEESDRIAVMATPVFEPLGAL